jgi:hypothetical protein
MAVPCRPPFAIFYHSPCVDGLAAATVLHMHLGLALPTATFHGVSHGPGGAVSARDEALQWLCDHPDGGSLVYLDVSPGEDVLAAWQLHSHNVALYVGDHHASERERLLAAHRHMPAMHLNWGNDGDGRSGVALAVEFVRDHVPSAVVMVHPDVVAAIAATDTTGMPNPISAYATTLTTHDAMAGLLHVDVDLESVKTAGQAILDAAKAKAAALAAAAKPLLHCGWLEVPLETNLQSNEVAAVLWETHPGAHTMVGRLPDGRSLSLRCRNAHAAPNCLDVVGYFKLLAPGTTGGGHKGAAGVVLPTVESFAQVSQVIATTLEPAPAWRTLPSRCAT